MSKHFTKLSIILLAVVTTTLLFAQFEGESQPSPFTIKKKTKPEFKEGDIIFQTSNSMQSQAIQLATQSKFSHVGVLVKHKGELVVLEAVQPVKYTPISAWINHGENGDYSLKRLAYADSIFTDSVLDVMRMKGNSWVGKNYDIAFDWSDEKLYCSELVWKLYQASCGLEVGKLKKLKDYDLTHPIVKEAIKERYGNKIPMESEMISPQAIYESDLLIDVN